MRLVHITSGDTSGEMLRESDLDGEVLVWRDILYDGPRNAGWPNPNTLKKRAKFLAAHTGGSLDPENVIDTLELQYEQLESFARAQITPTLWFDACLFDMSMLVHILACWRSLGRSNIELIVVDAYEGIERYSGLGQLTPEQLVAFYPSRQRLESFHFDYADTADAAFALNDKSLLRQLAAQTDAPLKWVPAAAQRWLDEEGDFKVIENLIFNALDDGKTNPVQIFRHACVHETLPQYWGDSTLWMKINQMAEADPPSLEIEGPQAKIPQWPSDIDLKRFLVRRR
jgi:hypothetical protein